MHSINPLITELKIEGGIYIFLGCISILLALFFWLIIKYSFHKGMAYALFLIGLFQLWRGCEITIRLPEQITAAAMQSEAIKHQINQTELIRNTGIILSVISLIALIGLRNPFSKFWKGLTLGLLIQATMVMLMETAILTNFVSLMNYTTNLK